MNTTARPPPTSAALLIALVQFLFVSCWTLYVVYLPQLLVQAGLPKGWTPWILLVDQLVFLVADVACGVYTDRVQRRLGRIGPLIAGATAVSCLAFLLLPHAVLLGPVAPALGLLLVLVWAVTSSALRAPPWVMLGKHAARPALPWLNALTLTGLAAGGAFAPYLGVVLKGVDPRLPFALASLTLVASTSAIVFIERRLSKAPAPAIATASPPRLLDLHHAGWMGGILLLALAFQTHFSLNSASQYLRFAAPGDLEWLMPLFWVGFGGAMLFGGALCRRVGALPAMAGAALAGAAAAAAAGQAPSLGLLSAAQGLAGAAWGTMLLAMFGSAADLGRSGREGLALGSMFAMLALATLLRIAAVLWGVAGAPALAWLPVVLWLAGAAVIALLVRPSRRAAPA